MVRCIGLLLSTVLLAFCGTRMAPSSGLHSTVGRDGGDQIKCNSSQANGFEGNYTLDFLLTADGARHPNLQTWEDHRDRIVTELGRKFPALATSLRDYLKYFLDPSDRNPRIWKPVTGTDLIDIPDEQISDYQYALPANCLTADGKPNLKQLVRREVLLIGDEAARKVFYFYDQNALEELRSTRPLQFSYIAIHEWLWDFVNSAWSNRVINHVFQTESLAQMSAREIKDHLTALGVPGVDGGSPDFNSAQERKISAEFADDPNCSFENRYVVDLLPLARSILLKSNQPKKLTTHITDTGFDGPVCGAAILFEHNSRASASTVQVKVGRGPLQLPEGSTGFMFASSAAATQSSLYAHCRESLCIQREGELAELISSRSVAGTTWDLTFTADNEVELANPVLIMIPRARR